MIPIINFFEVMSNCARLLLYNKLCILSSFSFISFEFHLRYSCVNLFLFVNENLNVLYKQTIEYVIGSIIEETYLFCFLCIA